MSDKNSNPVLAFKHALVANGHPDGLLTREEAEEICLTFNDPSGDGYMSASEVDFFGEADKIGGVVDDLITKKEAEQQGLRFFDGAGDPDGLMSRNDYADVQSGKADFFGAADRAGGVVDDLITKKEAEQQGLTFFDGDGDPDGLMSRNDYADVQSGKADFFGAADRASGVEDDLITEEEAQQQGLTFFDGDGDPDGLMSRTDYANVVYALSPEEASNKDEP